MYAGYNLHIDLWIEESADRLADLFTETGLLSMLNSCKYEIVVVVSPFLGLFG